VASGGMAGAAALSSRLIITFTEPRGEKEDGVKRKINPDVMVYVVYIIFFHGVSVQIDTLYRKRSFILIFAEHHNRNYDVECSSP
jgi:hypothetical protein